MEGSCGSAVVELPMSPRSPPGGGLDLYGKRRQMVKVQVLEREIGLLQEELKSVEDLPPASRCCKELDDFVEAKPDPFIAVNQETRKSKHFWKRLWVKFCSNFLCVCCSSGCMHHLQIQNCCMCSLCPSCGCMHHLQIQNCCMCLLCPSCRCRCLQKVTCQKCCKCMGLSCLCHGCCCFKSPIQKSKKVNLCSKFAKSCHNSCCM